MESQIEPNFQKNVINMFHKNFTNMFRKVVIREGNVMTNNKQIIYDTKDKNALRKAFKCNSPESLFLQPQKISAYFIPQ